MEQAAVTNTKTTKVTSGKSTNQSELRSFFSSQNHYSIDDFAVGVKSKTLFGSHQQISHFQSGTKVLR